MTEPIEKINPFNGQWMGGMSDVDGLQVGEENYTVLQNMRYTTGGGLEGVSGYSKINTSVINATTIEPRSIAQLRTDFTTSSYVLCQAENSAETASKVYQNQTAIPSQGNFTATEVHADASGAGLGRFSDYPGGNMAYCNGVESCIWAGNEMRCAALFTLWGVSITRDDVALNDNGANPDTIVISGFDFRGYGFKSHQTITISGATTAGNNGSFTAATLSVPGDTMYLPTGSLAGTDAAGASTVTIVVNTDTDYGNPIDWTEAANNSLTTEGNVIPIGYGLDSYTKLMLHADDQADGSQVITDSAQGLTVTANAGGSNAQIDTSQSKFGSGSILFDGTGDYLSIGDSDDWYMTNGAFTIEWWMKGTPAACGFFQQYVDADNSVLCYYDQVSDYVKFVVKESGDTKCELTVNGYSPFNGDGWNHIAIIRGWGGSNQTLAYCRNGEMKGTASFTADNGYTEWPQLAAALEIGRYITGGSPVYYTGRMDEFRISKGTARWISDFTPPVRPYTDTQQRKWLAMSTRPLKGVTYDIEEVNATASTTTAKVWTGKTFASLTVTDGTSNGSVSLAQDGSMTWTSTENIARPFYFEGLYLYAYLFELSAGSAEIKRISLNADFQSIVDVWDGVFRQPIAFQFWDDSEGRYFDYTLQVNTISDEYYPMGAIINAMTTSDHIIIMFDERMACFNFGMMGGLTNTEDATVTVEHWNGYGYVELDQLLDSTTPTTSAKSFAQSGTVVVYPPEYYEDTPKTDFGVTGFTYRVTVSATLSDLSADNGKQLTIETVTGIPAQTKVQPFAFPAMFHNRPMLCNFTKGSEKNRVDYGLTDGSDVWNGYETSMGGLQSLYIGGNEELVAAGQLYNRFGANIFATMIFLKRFEAYLLTGTGPDDFRYFPISLNIGCAAPLTLSFAEMGFEMADQVVRNIAIWLSDSGPVIFDGAVLAPLHGINKFFDVVDAEYFKTSLAERSWAVYDPRKFIWHLCIPSGSSAADCNKWVSFDFIKRKWYETVPAAYPQCACVVRDTNGIPYIYGGLNTGYVMRLDYGQDWDGTAISQVVETGDFFPTGSQWDESLLRRVKLIGKTLTEDTDTRIIHYSDTVASASSITRTDISFTATATIATAAGSFVTSGFRQGQEITFSGTANNNLAFTISSISSDGKTLTVSGNTVTAESAGASMTGTLTADVVCPQNSGSNRTTRTTKNLNITSWAHRLRFTTSTTATDKGAKLLGWGYQARRVRTDE